MSYGSYHFELLYPLFKSHIFSPGLPIELANWGRYTRCPITGMANMGCGCATVPPAGVPPMNDTLGIVGTCCVGTFRMDVWSQMSHEYNC